MQSASHLHDREGARGRGGEDCRTNRQGVLVTWPTVVHDGLYVILALGVVYIIGRY